jgi:hypothetical protein
MVTMVNADALAEGRPQWGWMFPRLKDPAGQQIYHISMPAMQYGTFPNDRAYLTQHNSHNGGPAVFVYGFDAFRSFPRAPKLVPFALREVAGTPNMSQKSSSNVPNPPAIKLSNVGSSLMRTVVRGNRLWTVFQEGVTWSGQNSAQAGVRYIRASLASFANGSNPRTAASGYIERTFGKRNKSESANLVFGYGMPAVEVDRNGNAIIAYVRSGTSIFQEARFTVHYDGESDIRPSLQLRAGEGTLAGAAGEAVGQLDCVGASLDPDGTSIWVAVPYAFKSSGSSTEGKYRIAVGRIRL